MDKKDDIFIKLQIEKGHQSGDLMLGVYFDRNAPNFLAREDSISWSPTFKELDFIVETFEMIAKSKIKHQGQDNSVNNDKPNYYKNAKEPRYVKNKSEKDLGETKKNNIEIEEEISPSKQEETEKPIFVQANEETIEEALKTKEANQDEDLKAGSDKKIVVDRVLKQKIKDKKSA
ncbi:MAG: hypothetical protein ACOC5T_04325 [Elusimicrobiota bacterium]